MSAVHPSQQTVGILLAGGQSRRYGSPKAFAVYEGRLFHERAYETLSAVCDPVVVSSSESLEERFPNSYIVRTDLPKLAGKGPLAGICTAMQQVQAERYLVLACDMPRVHAETIHRMIQLAQAEAASEVDVVALQAGEAYLPLLSIWRGGLTQRLEQEIESGQLSVMKLLAKLNTVWLDASQIEQDLSVFHNFNTPDAN